MFLKNKFMQAMTEGSEGGGVTSQAATPNTAVSTPITGGGDVKAVWPDNWRERFSSGDEKKAALAARYTSPEATFDALIAAQNKISSGNLKEVKPFPMKGTPDEQNVWRKENNLPESPDKYNLGEGVVIGESDKPYIDAFLKTAHAKNMTNEQVSAAIDWHFDNQEALMKQREEADVESAKKMTDALNAEWGGNYRTHKNKVESLLDMYAPTGFKDKLLSARLSDGTAFFNDPNAWKFLSAMALQLDPITTLVSGSGDQAGAVSDEIAKIEKFMGSNRKDYNKDAAMQARLLKLYEAREKLSAKGS